MKKNLQAQFAKAISAKGPNTINLSTGPIPDSVYRIKDGDGKVLAYLALDDTIELPGGHIQEVHSHEVTEAAVEMVNRYNAHDDLIRLVRGFEVLLGGLVRGLPLKLTTSGALNARIHAALKKAGAK